MSKLDAFLHPVEAEQTKEVIISKRFQDEKGKPVPFIIRTITGMQNDAIRNACTRKFKEKGAVYEDFDSERYVKKLLLTCVVEPDFSSQELCAAYGTADPMEVPGKMLLAGELNRLSKAISDLNGFDGGDLDTEAKNS